VHFSPSFFYLFKMEANNVQFTSNCVLFVFFRTKNNSQGESRADHLALVQQEDLLPETLTHLRNIKDPSTRNHVVLPMRPSSLNRILRRFEVPPNDLLFFQQQAMRRVRRRYTTHSVKRGAITHLWFLAAAQKMNPEMIPVIARHKSAFNVRFPSVTVEYAAALPVVARALQLDQAYHLLHTPTRPWNF
jgi:hypothetical protein